MSASEIQMARLALLEPAATRVIGKALAHGAPWRSWMAEAMPDAHASVEDAAIWLKTVMKAAMPPQEQQRKQGFAALFRMR